MPVVEIIAPSGCGKTTLYNGLRRKWRPSDSWVCYDDIRKVGWRRLLPGSTNDHSYWRSDAFMRRNPEFVDLCWQLVRSTSEWTGLRFADLLCTSFAMEHNVEALSEQRLVVLDEGIARRLVARWRSEPNELLERCISVAPLPRFLLVLEADAETITKRLIDRRSSGEESDTIRHLTQVSLAVVRRLTQAYADRGVTICRIDATRDPEQSLMDAVTALRVPPSVVQL